MKLKKSIPGTNQVWRMLYCFISLCSLPPSERRNWAIFSSISVFYTIPFLCNFHRAICLGLTEILTCSYSPVSPVAPVRPCFLISFLQKVYCKCFLPLVLPSLFHALFVTTQACFNVFCSNSGDPGTTLLASFRFTENPVLRPLILQSAFT